MATHRVRNIDRLGVEIGQISFVVPRIVLEELRHISRGGNAKKTAGALQAIDLAGTLGHAALDHDDHNDNDSGHGPAHTADDLILGHVRAHGGIVATMDRHLKRRLKEARGCTIISFSNDNIIMEY